MSGQRTPRLTSVTGCDALWGSTGLDPSLAKYARNFYPGGEQAGRRRRGFRILRSISTSAVRAIDGIEVDFAGISTWRLYKYDTVLYQDDGTTVSSLSTGWDAYAPVTFFEIVSATGMKAIVVYQSETKREMVWLTGGVLVVTNFSLAAPLVAGVAVASSATAGALFAGNSHDVYIVNYNATRGRQSGPIGPFTVTIGVGQTSYDINTLPAAPADAQYTHFKVYRTKAYTLGGTPGTPLFSQSYAVALAGTLVNDGVADTLLTTTDPLPFSAYGDYFLGVPPGGSGAHFAIEYKGMVLDFVSGGKMYFTSPGSDHRWSANYRVSFKTGGSDITAAAEGNNELIVATGRAVYSLSGSGLFTGTPPIPDWKITKLSSEFGAFNPKCLLSVGTSVYGLGPGGAFVVDAGGIRPLKKVVRPDRLIDGDYLSVVPPSTSGSNLPCLGYDPKRRVLLASIAIKGTVNSAQAPAMVLAEYPIDETGKVGWHDLKISSFMQGGGRKSFISGGTDYGLGLMGFDCYGNHIELEYGDNDGMASTVAYTVLTVAGGAPTTSVSITATSNPPVLPARGVRVVGIPLDPTADPTVGTVLSTSGLDTIVIADWGASAAVGTVFYLGGILGWYETGAILFDSCDDGGFSERVLSSVNLYLHDLIYDESDSLATPFLPHVWAQIKVDGGDWGPRVLVYNGNDYAAPGKGASLTGKVASGGTTKAGVSIRFRFLAVSGNRPVRFFAFEVANSDGGKPKAAGV